MSGTGFVDVATNPAGANSLSVPGLGRFQWGAGPTIGPDGTVYLGTLEGRVIALHADGSPYWNRELPAGSPHWIIASPAVGSDQSVYVVGTSSAVVRDHRTGDSVNTYYATLYRFTADGGAPVGNSTAIPDLRPGLSAGLYGPRFTGEPSIWQFGADEAVMVPVAYPTLDGEELHILAFAPSGGVMADVTVARWNAGDVTGTGWSEFLAELWNVFVGHFAPAPVESNEPWSTPIPGLSVFTNPRGGTRGVSGTPLVTIPNRLQHEIVTFTFCVGSSCSPAPGFTERVRIQPAVNALLSSPLTLPDLHTAVGTDDGVAFGGPSQSSAPPVTGFGAGVWATPTLGVDGRVVLVTGDASVIGLKDHAITSRLSLASYSAARAAASRNHVFVSTTNGLHTLDALAQSEVFNFPWDGGGVSPPAIGPDGRVYALASNILFIFPPPYRAVDPSRRPFA